MAWYDKLLGNDPNDPNKVSGEELLGLVPELIGSYEEGRHRPIGGPLKALGELTMKQGEKRQAFGQEQSSDLAELRNLTARFGQQDPNLLNANSPQMQALGDQLKIDPAGAKAQIAQMYNEQSAVEQNRVAEEQKLRDEQMKPMGIQIDKSGRARQWDWKTRDWVRRPDWDIPGGGNDPKSIQGAFVKQWLGAHNGDSTGMKEAWDKLKTKQQIDVVNAMPFTAARNMANKRIIDLKNGEAVAPVNTDGSMMSFGEVNRKIAQKQYGLVSDKDMQSLDNINRVGGELGELAQVVPKVLTPTNAKQPWTTMAKTLAQKYKIPALSWMGNTDAAQYEASREGVALEIQQILTNSTRPVALQEMGIVMGDEYKGDLRNLDFNHIISIVPNRTDTAQTAWKKMQLIDKLLRTKKRDITGEAGRSFLEAPQPPSVIEEPEMPESSESPASSAGDGESF